MDLRAGHDGLDALAVKTLYMHCKCTHTAPTELVLSGTRQVGQSALSFNPHPCKGCFHSPDTARGEMALEFAPARSFEFGNCWVQGASLSLLCSQVCRNSLRSLPVVQGACRGVGGSDLPQSFTSMIGTSRFVTTITVS